MIYKNIDFGKGYVIVKILVGLDKEFVCIQAFVESIDGNGVREIRIPIETFED